MAEDERERLSPVQVWLLAARPKTLPAAVAPVIVGSAVAYHDSAFRFELALAALLVALLLQIGANLANDVFDFQRGADLKRRFGPLRVTQSGLLSPRQVLRGMWIIFGLASLLGIYLFLAAGWPVILMGAASILAAIAYTGGPLPYGYYGLGDLFVFLFFGLVAVCGTYFIQAGGISPLALWASLPMGLLITAILVVNNLRDIESDRSAGKRTLAVRLGVRGTRLQYLFCLLGAYLVSPLVWGLGLTSGWVLLSWFSLPLAGQMVRSVWREEGRLLNNALAGTGRLTLLYGVLFALGVALSV